jgi:anti-anti-sigma factor
MPGEIDTTNAESAFHRLCAEASTGGHILIADFTGTSFCDSTSLRHLLVAQDRAAARGTELRLAVLPGSAVRHLMAITGLDKMLPIYESLERARAAPPAD